MPRKTVFFTVWQIEEIRKESSGDYFLYRVHKFLSPKLGGKAWRENFLTELLPECPFQLLSSQTQRLFGNQVRKKKKKNRERELDKKKRGWEHFLNEGERKKRRTNVYGVRKKKKTKQTNGDRELEKKKKREWEHFFEWMRKRKKRMDEKKR